MLRIQEPFHGAVLNRRMGEQTDAGLKIRVVGRARLGDAVSVNGAAAERRGERFEAEVTLTERETDIVARAVGSTGEQVHRIRVLWDQHSMPRYRFSIDDNSFFLRDLHQKQYASLFDCFYLKGLLDLHEKYGVKFVLNIYFTTGDDFDLTQLSDRYKSEWADHAHWLKLAFHAYANDPDRPYQYATAEKLLGDLDKVAEQIVRFAGEETYSPPTVIHWGMVQPDVWPRLASRGVKVLSGYFGKNAGGVYDVHYFLDDDRCEYLERHDALMDFDSGIAFSRVDIVCNNTPVDQIVPTLAPLAENPETAEIMDLFTHEQYFWPFYHNYVPDHFARLEEAIRWVTEQGYAPVHFHEGFLGAPE